MPGSRPLFCRWAVVVEESRVLVLMLEAPTTTALYLAEACWEPLETTSRLRSAAAVRSLTLLCSALLSLIFAAPVDEPRLDVAGHRSEQQLCPCVIETGFLCSDRYFSALDRPTLFCISSALPTSALFGLTASASMRQAPPVQPIVGNFTWTGSPGRLQSGSSVLES
ncbi:hypothetical protein GGR56DRAFT_661329 [Xylariaceae sp. FL0804]|nr:hypothetical protein GGR56DRAFT_661329 [Xylariaceae sp. FL0804]